MELYVTLTQSFLYGGVISVVLLLLAGVALLAVLRRYWKRRTVCWFCHAPQPAGWGEGGWSCVSCHQYNGFTEETESRTASPMQQDGSYDREMTEQHTAVDCISTRYCTAGSSDLAPPPSSAADLLCSQCDQNLHLKVAQLASFQPTSEACFEEEATEYEQSVEKLYPLCASCEQKVANEISQRDHMIRPLLLNTKRTSPLKRKPSLSRQKCSWIFKLLQLTSIAISLWCLLSLLHCHKNPCRLSHHYCAPSRYRLGSSRQLYSPLNTTSLLRQSVTGSTPGAAIDMSHDQRNSTCWARRTIDQFYEYVITPKEYWYVKICCRVFICLCWLAGFASSSQSQAITVLFLMVFDTTLSFNRKQRKLHLCLLVLDTALLCLLPHTAVLYLLPQVCFQLPLPMTRYDTLSPLRLGGMLATVFTALRVLGLLVGHCSSRRQQRKSYLRGPKKRRERVEPENSPLAVQNSLSGLSIGRAASGSRQKSWLKSLEEMNLLSPMSAASDTTSYTQQTSNGDNKSNGMSFNTSPNGIFTHKSIEKPHPPDGRKRPLLRPARLRYRRQSISSATAALSLSNSNPWSGGMEQELPLSLTAPQPPKPPPVVSPLNDGLNCVGTAEGGPSRLSETQTTVATAAMKPGQQNVGRRCPRMMTALLVVSVASNVLLLACLLLHLNSPDVYRQYTKGFGGDGHL